MYQEFLDSSALRIQQLLERVTGSPVDGSIQAEIASILQNPQAARVEATSREVTIIVADLRGFTAFSDAQAAPVVIASLNECLERLSQVILRHRGTIDKFNGESIRVLFGAPESHADDVARALMCAVEMQMAIYELNLEHQKARLPQIFLGIGVNTGTAIAGHFGSKNYSDYTVIGEEVQLTSRIEAFSLRGQVLISESTYRRAGDLVTVSDSIQVFVNGREQPVSLWELIAIPSCKLKVPRQEFRRSHRVEVCLPCSCQRIGTKNDRQRFLHGTIRDIGYHGVQVEMSEPMELHTEVRLEFDLTQVDYWAANASARVVGIKQTAQGWVAGMEFTSISPDCNAKIQAFVKMLIEPRSAVN